MNKIVWVDGGRLLLQQCSPSPSWYATNCVCICVCAAAYVNRMLSNSYSEGSRRRRPGTSRDDHRSLVLHLTASNTAFSAITLYQHHVGYVDTTGNLKFNRLSILVRYVDQSSGDARNGTPISTCNLNATIIDDIRFHRAHIFACSRFIDGYSV